ncbi:MAG: hypothetical protein L0Z55_06935 [Planctomycetes bacterium]|nr:hypothetical protein [Planctomycetota bacterium]
MRGLRLQRRTKLWLVGALGAFGALIAAACLLLIDEPPHDDSDLRVVRRAVADAANGIRFLDFPDGTVKWPDPKGFRDSMWLQPGAGFDRRKAERMLESNAEVLQRFDACIAAEDLHVTPGRWSYWNSHLSSLVKFSEIRKLVAARSWLQYLAGNHRAALDDALALLLLGYRIQNAEGPSGEYCMGLMEAHEAAQHLLILVPKVVLTVEHLRNYAARALSLSPSIDSLQSHLRIDYEFWGTQLDLVEAAGFGVPTLFGSGPMSAVLLKKNKTKRILATNTRNLIEASLLPTAARGIDKPKWMNVRTIYRTSRAPRRWLDPTSRLLAFRCNEGLLFQRDDVELRVAAASVMLALRGYALKHETLPESLADLVPDHLDRVPRDPYDGAPLRYSRERRILYSVGADFIDSGGSRTARPSYDDKEPTFPIEFA